MPDVIVTEDEPADDGRELGRAEGAAEVHKDEAADQAQRAEDAASIAITAVDQNMSIAESAADNAARAEEAAAVTEISNSVVLEALQENTATVRSLLDELQAGREAKSAAPPAEPKEKKPTAERQPKQKKRFGARYQGQ